MSKRIKVYDKNGKYVDSFNANAISVPNPDYAKHLADPLNPAFHGAPETLQINGFQAIEILNSHGYYVRKQFSKSGKTLIRSIR